jgi:hexosaminidase
MLDSARHYQSPEYLRRFIDAMALHKLNVLHWHLTDDQAWRLEIRKYPKLTEVGAWRVPAGAAAQDIDPATGAARRYGGFYSQQTVRELVAYAAARGIGIVPEIEMPGHASAAIAAYPWLGADPAAVPQVPADWGIYPNAFALDERTFGFLQDVLRETLDLFPSRYVHVGGDEVEPAQWQKSSAGRALAAKLEQGRTLQSYFTGRIARFLEQHGRRLVGWDEILAPGLAPDAVVMSWRGSEGAQQAAARGHDAVLAVWPTLYFDNRQAEGAEQPPGRVRTIGLREVYSFEPVPAGMPEVARDRLLGLQGNIWTEHIRSESRADAMSFPRLAAVAELGWTDEPRRDWAGFVHRLPVLWPHYRALGVAASDAEFAPRLSARYGEDRRRATVSISTPEPVGEIRYTLDGSAPGPDSPRYLASLVLPLPSEVRAATFLARERLGEERRLLLDPAAAQSRTSRELTLCSEGIGLMLEDDAPPNGPRAVFSADIQNPCWIFERAELDRVVAIDAGVGQVPFNFQIGAARESIRFPAPRTQAGELLVFKGRNCEGEAWLRLPLEPAVASAGITRLPRLVLPPQQGVSDLCLRFAQAALEPLWLLDSIRLVER